MRLRRYFGPSTLVAAAFIGPGTIATCTKAGGQAGYGLLWALVFAVIATIVFQEMAARLGLISQKGLGEAIRDQLKHPILKIFGISLVIAAIGLGNAAYEAGNISGALLGINAVAGDLSKDIGGFTVNLWPVVLGVISFAILWVGEFKWVERLLIGLVALMSLVFLISAVLIQPAIGEIFKGFVPGLTETPWLTVVALIGTTVVPYNLFLHASSVREKYKDADDLRDLRIENAVAIILGGIISMSIVVVSGTVFRNLWVMPEEVGGNVLALGIMLGDSGKYLLGTGLFAAGLSSAITAPLAAAYALKGVLGWEGGIRSARFRVIWAVILLLGVVFSMLGYKPVELIYVAQVANGLLLPVIAIFLLVMVNRRQLLGRYVNTMWQNVLGGLVMVVILLLTTRTILSLIEKWG